MSSPAIDIGLSVLNGQTNIQNVLNSSDLAEQLNNLAQLAAGLATLATSPAAALAVVDINLAAATLTIAKMALDINEGRPFNRGDALSVVGNVLAIGLVVGMNITPTGKAVGYFIKAARLLGGLQLFDFALDQAKAAELAAAQLPRINGTLPFICMCPPIYDRLQICPVLPELSAPKCPITLPSGAIAARMSFLRMKIAKPIWIG